MMLLKINIVMKIFSFAAAATTEKILDEKLTGCGPSKYPSISVGSTCFVFMEKAQMFGHANEDCTTLNTNGHGMGSLATLDTPLKRKVVKHWAAAINLQGDTWVGLKKNRNGIWGWLKKTNGSAIDLSFYRALWLPQQPDNAAGVENVGVLQTKTGLLYDSLRYEQHSSICQFDLDETQASALPSRFENACDRVVNHIHYEFDTFCLILNQKKMSFHDARQACHSIWPHSQLAVANSAEKLQSIASFLSDLSIKSSWLGLGQIKESVEPNEGWMWIDGQSHNQSLWAQGEPNNVEELEHVGLLDVSAVALFDYPKYRLFESVCEFEMNPNFELPKKDAEKVAENAENPFLQTRTTSNTLHTPTNSSFTNDTTTLWTATTSTMKPPNNLSSLNPIFNHVTVTSSVNANSRASVSTTPTTLIGDYISFSQWIDCELMTALNLLLAIILLLIICSCCCFVIREPVKRLWAIVKHYTSLKKLRELRRPFRAGTPPQYPPDCLPRTYSDYLTEYKRPANNRRPSRIRMHQYRTVRGSVDVDAAFETACGTLPNGNCDDYYV